MFPAGSDKRFPRGTVYPGVLALFRELDLGVKQGSLFHKLVVTTKSPGGAVVKVVQLSQLL